MTEEFAASPYRLHAPLKEQHDFATATQYARSAVKKIVPMARLLRAVSIGQSNLTILVSVLEGNGTKCYAKSTSLRLKAPQATALAYWNP